MDALFFIFLPPHNIYLVLKKKWKKEKLQAESCVVWQALMTSPIEIYIQMFPSPFFKLNWQNEFTFFPKKYNFSGKHDPKERKKRKPHCYNYMIKITFGTQISVLEFTLPESQVLHVMNPGNTNKTKRCKFSVQQRFPLKYLNSEWSQSAHPGSREILHKSQSEMVGEQWGKGCPAPVWSIFQKI